MAEWIEQWSHTFPLMKTVPVPELNADEAPPCLRRTESTWTRARRRRRPVNTVSDCCWYHGGNWHLAIAFARFGILEAHKRGITGYDAGDWAAKAAERSDHITGWMFEAVESLVRSEHAIVIEEDEEEGRWIFNGRHRLAAMFHTGARFTLAAQFDLIDPTTGKPVND